MYIIDITSVSYVWFYFLHLGQFQQTKPCFLPFYCRIPANVSESFLSYMLMGSRTITPKESCPWMIAPRTIAPKDNCPQGKLPAGQFLPRIIAPKEN